MPAAAPPAAALTQAPSPYFKRPDRVDYALAGTALVALATSATFGTWGLVQRYNEEHGGCAPFCTEDEKALDPEQAHRRRRRARRRLVSLAVLFFHMRAPARADAAGAPSGAMPMVYVGPGSGAGVGWRGTF